MSLGTIEKLEGGRIRDPENGLIMPWYTSTCLEWLRTLDFEGKRVFEYGVGDSTLWYSQRLAFVDGIESNFHWSTVAVGLVYYRTEKKEYTEAIYHMRTRNSGFNRYDMVIIDGDYRDDCTVHALQCLKHGGYLIIDNYHQPSVEPNIWTQTDKLIEGMPITIYKEPNHEDWQTAVITKP